MVKFTLMTSLFQEILGVPTIGLDTMKDNYDSEAFLDNISISKQLLGRFRILKKKMKPKFQLVFELISKVPLPRDAG